MLVGVLIVVFGLCMRMGRMELSIEIPYDPAIPLLVIYPNEGTQIIYPCSQQYYSQWPKNKQPKCLSDEWLNKMYVPTMKYYSALKRKKILTCAVTWMNLDDTCRVK